MQSLSPTLSLQASESLFERGLPEFFEGDELLRIGMPVGGICAGQVYLRGDGKLCHWDVFNRVYNSYDYPLSCDKAHYQNPQPLKTPLEQGFGAEFVANGKSFALRLDASGFTGIQFRGEYPIGTVRYQQPGCPVRFALEAFSPFIPLDEENSSLPAILLNYTVTNDSQEAVEVTLKGWLENTVCADHADRSQRLNRLVGGKNLTFLECATGAVPSEWREHGDFGTMGLALLDAESADVSDLDWQVPGAFSTEAISGERGPVGMIGQTVRLASGESRNVTFAVTWYFPNLRLEGLPTAGRHYATRFDSSQAVATYLAQRHSLLAQETRLWRDTWYDSTLPYWFLDRTFLNASTLATATVYRFPNGRFYGWEGVGSCAGTCTHVWQYAHSVARLFPVLERSARLLGEYEPSAGLNADGSIGFRAELYRGSAVDGQAGTILRVYREHQMSADDSFLREIWPRVRQSLEYLISRDSDGDGLLDGPQHNTLDAAWHGQIAWLCGLYGAALRAGEQMARELDETEFADHCQQLAEQNYAALPSLFNGEYFINRVDAQQLDAINSGTGCAIDQVFGQSWAFQVGLERIFPEPLARQALEAIWKYNYIPDAGTYRESHPEGRWYAADGEPGLLMCFFARPDWDYEKAAGKGPSWAAGYFNEFMNGFEYQVAGHMLWEGMPLEAMTLVRAVHERYHPSKRNPWNEFECGDHYARSMASYGVFLAASGYETHGPKKHLGFAPRIHPENFRAAFTAAEGWGSFAQTGSEEEFRAEIEIKWGRLSLRTLSLELPPSVLGKKFTVKLKNQEIEFEIQNSKKSSRFCFSKNLILQRGDQLIVESTHPSI